MLPSEYSYFSHAEKKIPSEFIQIARVKNNTNQMVEFPPACSCANLFFRRLSNRQQDLLTGWPFFLYFHFHNP